MVWNFKEWYDKNKNTFNESRRKRYAEDSEYRDRIRNWNKRVHEAKREKALSERNKEKAAVKIKLRSTAPVQREIDGQTVVLFPIGVLAKAVGRGVQSLRRYERSGRIPKTPYKAKNGMRLYTAEQIEKIRAILSDQNRLGSQSFRPHGIRMPRPSFVRFSDGVEKSVVLFRVGYLALALERTVQYVTQMEAKGRFPETSLRSHGHRLYTKEMIESAKSVLDTLGGTLRGGNLERFSTSVKDEWVKLGVVGAKVIS
jgi:hypothetical protein